MTDRLAGEVDTKSGVTKMVTILCPLIQFRYRKVWFSHVIIQGGTGSHPLIGSTFVDCVDRGEFSYRVDGYGMAVSNPLVGWTCFTKDEG